MGVHKNIRDLNPLALYTFDRTEAYVEIETNTGYCANRTEYDFPPLMIKNSGLFYKGYDLKVIQPALSEIEQNTKYQSFSTGIPQYITLGYTDAKAKAFQYSLNNGSVYADADLSEQEEMILSTGTYTVSFQLSGGILGTPPTVPLHRIVEDIASNAYYGHFAHATIVGVDNPLLKEPVKLSMGYTLEEKNTNIDCINSFGYGSTFDLYYTLAIDKVDKPIPYPYPMYYAELYNTNVDILFFKFRNIKLYARYSGGQYITIILKSFQLDQSVTLFNMSTNEICSFFIIVTGIHVKVYVNERLVGSYNTEPPIEDDANKLHVGIKTEWRLSNKRDKELNMPLYEPVSPMFNLKIDNIAFYNREITKAELLNIYYTNYNYTTIFKKFGYSQLYDFSDLYHSSARRYIENRTDIRNVLGGTSYLQVQNDSVNLPYVVKNNANDYEYVFKCTKRSSIQTERNNNNYAPISMIRGSGTLSFLFRTSDLHGVLFANTLYEHNNSNVILLLNYGYLEIWVANTLVSRISDISNNEWHEVFIAFGSLTNFYIDKILYYSHPRSVVNTNAVTLFGNALPGNTDLECEYALIGFSSNYLSPEDLDILTAACKVAYSAYGQITLNNIAVGTNIFIYNRYTGSLIEKIQSDSADGTFSYINRYPYTISVVVTDSTLISGKTYIVDPVEIE